MAEDTILNLMVNHHVLLEALFSLFKDEAREKSPRARASFDEFTWELKKHFFVEENAIFDFIPLKDFGVFELINHLKDEHLAMLIDLNKISDRLPEIKDEDLENFFKLLSHHREEEDKDLYPKLDKEMRDDQKKEVILRINQVPMGAKNIK
ncbi:MAG: hemerythrin domain-containing protein [Candidatus Staskawiczbacteria bacterium]|nr:hemerythrin domain-containing protein [Candidatus Staskawiczbacteria bacterium]